MILNGMHCLKKKFTFENYDLNVLGGGGGEHDTSIS